jgi:hypothetical protein
MHGVRDYCIIARQIIYVFMHLAELYIYEMAIGQI